MCYVIGKHTKSVLLANVIGSMFMSYYREGKSFAINYGTSYYLETIFS